MSQYASEHECRWIDVRCTRMWMRVDLATIADYARGLARDAAGGREVPDVAYTWEGEGFVWEECKRGDEGAVGFWRCELRA